MDPIVNNHAHIPHLRPVPSVAGSTLPDAARAAEGPMRAIQADDDHKDTAPAEWLKQALRWSEAIIEGRAG